MWATATLPAAATVTTAASQRQRVLPVPGSSPQRHARPTTTTTGACPPGRERHGTAGDPGRVTEMVAARTEATTHPSPPPDTIRGRTHAPNGFQAASAGGTAKTIPSPTKKTIVTVETTATNQQPAPIPGDRKSATANQKTVVKWLTFLWYLTVNYMYHQSALLSTCQHKRAMQLMCKLDRDAQPLLFQSSFSAWYWQIVKKCASYLNNIIITTML